MEPQDTQYYLIYRLKSGRQLQEGIDMKRG